MKIYINEDKSIHYYDLARGGKVIAYQNDLRLLKGALELLKEWCSVEVVDNTHTKDGIYASASPCDKERMREYAEELREWIKRGN